MDNKDRGKRDGASEGRPNRPAVRNGPAAESEGPDKHRRFAAGLSQTGAAQAAQPARRPPRDLGDIGMHIARDGSWFYRGSPITRASLVRLFASVLNRDDKGDYWLVTPAEKARVSVEDTPFLAVELTVASEGRGQALIFRTNVDDNVTADSDHPLRIATDGASGAPNPYIAVRDGLEARLTRPVFYQLVDLGREERVGVATRFGVWSKNRFFPLGEIA
jgi:uncharacterized protein